ncbi:MAG: alpha/beta fold hydrolase [Pseudomonadota bacterium]
MGAVQRLYADGPFGQIHGRLAKPDREGAKPPLVCLHQSPKSGLEFEAFMRVASVDRILVAPDYPGYGMSDAPPSESEATIPAYAKSAWALADALDLGRVDLFGNHTGSKVAAEMAVQRPGDVRAIAMVSAAILTDEERAQFDGYFQPVPLDRDGTRFKTMWERIVHHAGPGMTLEMMAVSMRQNMMGGEAYEWGHAAAFAWGPPFEAALAELPHPITILNPGDELQEATRRAAPLMKAGEIIELPDWGHGFLDVQAEDAARLVTGRLDAAG